MRAFGVEGADDQGAPLVNVAVDRYHKAGLLGRGISFYLGRALLAGAKNPQDAAERVKSAERLRDAVVKAIGRIHKMLTPEQRARFAYLIRTGVLSI